MKKNTHQFINRELSWLAFNQRVLGEAFDDSLPLLERVKFAAIAAANLDEFLMVRVGGLQLLAAEGSSHTDSAGKTPPQQLAAIGEHVQQLTASLSACFLEQLEPELMRNQIQRLMPAQLDSDQRDQIEELVRDEITAVASPLAMDESFQPPMIANQTLHVAVLLKNSANDTRTRLICIPLAAPLSRFLTISAAAPYSYILLEDVVQEFLGHFLPAEEVIASTPFRILRNADISVREDLAHDLLEQMESLIDARKEGACIRLEVSDQADQQLVDRLADFFDIDHDNIAPSAAPLDLAAWFRLAGLARHEHLQYTSWPPQPSPQFDLSESLFSTIAAGDVLLEHPFDSFDPVVRLLEEAAEDPQVLAIKQTLYHTSAESPIVQALALAAQRGKYVTAIVELKARFDEQRNIEWARDLQHAGVQVMYGVKGLKTHAKMCMIVRRETDGIRRYLHLGTGNYNESTARLYTDISYFTCNRQLGSDVAGVFNAITGFTEPPVLHRVAMSPLSMRDRFTEAINQETARAARGEVAAIRAKLNSLVDEPIIKALYRASAAGVTVDLNVRGICCLRPGVKGLSENIRVVSIVDRFLEHSRIFYFHNGGEPNVFFASADWMPRNLNRRVELLAPVEDPACRDRLVKILDVCLADNVKGHLLAADGSYQRLPADSNDVLSSQQRRYEWAVAQVKAAEQSKPTRFEPHRQPGNS